MVISMPPIAIVLTIVVISNCIISFGKSNVMNKCHVILSSVLSFVGIVGMIIIRPRFVESLNRNANARKFESDFVASAIEKFDFFAVISIAATCSVVIFLLFWLILNKGSFVWANTTIIVITLMIISFIAGVWYGFGTINKLFDIAGYILQLSIYGIFALHIPLVVKRILVFKK